MALQILFFILCLKGAGATLHVDVSSSPVEAQSGSNVLLECYFRDSSAKVDLKKLVVTWRLRKIEGQMPTSPKEEVAIYDMDQDDEIVIKTTNAKLFKDEIQQGNASLLLMNITSADAGEYECSILYLDIKTKTLTLNVLAPPPPTTTSSGHTEVEDYSTDEPGSGSNIVAGFLVLQTVFVVMYLL